MDQIQPDDAKREIEAAIGQPCAFRWTPRHDVSTDANRIEMLFTAGGHGVKADLYERDLALPMDQFRRRLIEPLVALWRHRATNGH